jgi:Flp pilus assembly protein TadG
MHLSIALARRQRGQAAAEFVLILPFFVGLLLLVVDLGVLMYEYTATANAVREGARFAAVGCPPSASCTVALVQSRVINRSGGILDSANQSEVSAWYCDRGLANTAGENYPHRGDTVTVKVDHAYSLQFVLGANFRVQSQASMVMESDNAGSNIAIGSGGSC